MTVGEGVLVDSGMTTRVECGGGGMMGRMSALTGA